MLTAGFEPVCFNFEGDFYRGVKYFYFVLCTLSVLFGLIVLALLLSFTVQHTQVKHPYCRRDSNPQPQQAIGSRPSPYTTRPLGMAG